MQQKLSLLLKESNKEVKTIGEVAVEIFNGISIPKETKGTLPAIKSGDITKQESLFVNKVITYIEEGKRKTEKVCSKEDILIVRNSMSKKSAGKSYLYEAEFDCVINSKLYVVKHLLNPRYFLYFLNSQRTKKYIQKSIEKFFKFSDREWVLHKEEIKRLQLPIPPRHIQDLIGDYLYRLSGFGEELEKRNWNSFITIARSY